MFISGTGGLWLKSNTVLLMVRHCCDNLEKKLCCLDAMTRKWAVQTRYMLWRYTASIIKDLSHYKFCYKKQTKCLFLRFRLFFFSYEKCGKIKKLVTSKVNKKLTTKYAAKNKLIVCFNNSHCLIFSC